MKLTVFVLLALIGVASAQQPAPPAQNTPYTLHIKSNLVVLDVVVTDAKGNTVPNLKRDDFEIYENKVPQKLRTLEEQNAKTATVPAVHSTAELDKLAPNAPVSILVLDEVTSGFSDEAFTRYSLKRYLSTEGDALTQPTMLIALSLGRFNVLHDYTTSKEEILQALDHHFAASPLQSERSFASEQFSTTLLSLVQVAEATAGHPGHKNMIWIGRGFPSLDPTQMLAEDADKLHTLIETCTNLLRDSRVTLYTVDPAGLPTAPPTEDENGFISSDPFGGQIDFNTMAQATGGKTFFGRNDVDNLIAASVTAGENFYTLSYTPTNNGDSKNFRNITVRLKDRSLIAATRAGYYSSMPPPAANSEAKVEDEAAAKKRMGFDMASAANSNMVYDAVPFNIERSTTDPNDFYIRISAADVDWQPSDGDTLSADVLLLIQSFDKKGNSIKRVAHSFDVRSAPTPSDPNPHPKPIELRISIPTGAPASRVRIVVRMNDNGKMGAQNLDLTSSSTERK